MRAVPSKIKGLIVLQKEFAAQGFTVVGVSVDPEGASEVKGFTRAVGMNYPVVIGDEKVFADYGPVMAMPTTFVLDRKGNIVTSHIGATTKTVFESEIRPLLEQK